VLRGSFVFQKETIMTHTYNITGMTCSGCVAKVTQLLSAVEGITKVDIDLSTAQAIIQMDKHVATAALQQALKDHPNYHLSEAVVPAKETIIAVEEKKPWLKTYKPILLIFGYILLSTLLVEWNKGAFHWMPWMNNFMAAFFLVFSFFKLLNLRGFADSYGMYDIVAKRLPAWGFIYPFVELALGFAFLTGFSPLITNAVTLVVMTVSIIGVLQSVLNKRKIKCACLGDVFNLPMSTITIVEDALMMGMSIVMLLTML